MRRGEKMYNDPQDRFRDLDEMFAQLFGRMTRDFSAGDPRVSGYTMIFEDNGDRSPAPFVQYEQEREGTEPAVEVHRIDNEIKVIAGLPGVTRDALHLTMKENKLFIDADTGTLQYHTTTTLPPVDPDSMQVSLKNGVLEVTFGILDRLPGDAAQ